MIDTFNSIYANNYLNASLGQLLGGMSQFGYQRYLENHRNYCQPVAFQMNTKNEVDSNDKLLLLIED